MRKLLALLVAACFCLAPVATLAGNTNPTYALEIYQLDTDPDDPGPPPSYLCYHASRPLVGELQCFTAKAAFNFAIVPLHVGRLDTPPLAPGWPLPCGPGGGWVTVSYGMSKTGVTVTYVGLAVCPDFLQGPGTAPGAILVTATTVCHDWLDHPCYAKYMSSAATGATFFTIIGNIEDNNQLDLINCQVGTEGPLLTVAGGAQWGGTKSITCPSGAIDVSPSTWGAIKALYR